VPERKTVLACGGRIAIVGDRKTHATKDMIRKLKSRHGTPRHASL
jgi:hypothetical protein